MKILLTGAAGQLGTELLPLLRHMGKVISIDRGKELQAAPDAVALDLAEANQLEGLLDAAMPDLVINAAAYTAVDRAEQEPEQAFTLNAGVPARIASWAARHDRGLIHFSTDYVFDGTSTLPYTEDANPCAVSVYGQSKLEGENAILESGCPHAVIRTSWVYSGHHENFVVKMLELAASRPALSVVDDQVGCPTWARNLAAAAVLLIRKKLHPREPEEGPVQSAGLLHYCDADAVSWYGFAELIFKRATALGLIEKPPELKPVASHEFPQVAKRPAYSVLDSSQIAASYGIVPVALDASLSTCLGEMSKK
jgi:dTDP-4-dehydrorhamnose reductase